MTCTPAFYIQSPLLAVPKMRVLVSHWELLTLQVSGKFVAPVNITSLVTLCWGSWTLPKQTHIWWGAMWSTSSYLLPWQCACFKDGDSFPALQIMKVIIGVVTQKRLDSLCVSHFWWYINEKKTGNPTIDIYKRAAKTVWKEKEKAYPR